MGFVKRFLPFFAAFALGLFVASFFVSVGFPRFERQGKRHGRHHRCNSEIEQLRRENFELRRQIDRLKTDVPPVELVIPAESVPKSK